MIAILLTTLAMLGGTETTLSRKELTTTKIEQAPKIDGELTESHWLDLEPVHFTQIRPNNGQPSAFTTAVGMVYTDRALYVAVRMYDPEPHKISKEFGLRDDFDRNVDWFGVLIDPYQSGINAFGFLVSAAGVQADNLLSINNFDFSWDAVWNSAIKHDDYGWTAEIEIPYYAIRFPKQEIQTWGINFYRLTKRLQEESFWSPVDISVNGIANQLGQLNGIKDIQPPLRLSFLPYITTIYQHNGTEGSYNLAGGMDLKYGINESFTLDVSLIPDFSQVQSDNIVLNLSAFEVQFAENRPFFTEGTELFNKGNLFYSRRVGQTFGSVHYDQEHEEVINRPNTAPLINALKLSGRNQNGLGLGFFNAVTNQTFATIRNKQTGNERQTQVDPLTNFNVFVIDQNLKNNSNINFTNTSVLRSGNAPDANVSGLSIAVNDKTNTYGIRTFGAVNSILSNSEGGRSNDVGYKYLIEVLKFSGTWQYGAFRNVESDNYNINDLGYLQAPNEITHRAFVSYNVFNPVGIFNRYSASWAVRHEQLFAPQQFSFLATSVNLNAQFKSFWYSGLNVGTNPLQGYDYFEPRMAGWYYLQLPTVNGNFFIGTDDRKPFQVEAFKGGWRRPEWEQSWDWHGASVRYRASDKLSFSMSVNREKGRKNRGYVRKLNDENGNLSEIIFGDREILTYNNIMGVKYTFNSKMGLNLRVRHYWSGVAYQKFYKLGTDGDMHATEYDGFEGQPFSKHDTNFNIFNVDMVYFMQIAPGSFLNIMWKDAIQTADVLVADGYVGNLDRVMRAPQQNSLSLRLTYFIDYMSVKRSLQSRS